MTHQPLPAGVQSQTKLLVGGLGHDHIIGGDGGAVISHPGTIQTVGTAPTVTINAASTTTPGVYTLVISGTGASAGTIRAARVQVTVTGRPECAGTNGSDVPIPDGSGSTVSQIAIASYGGNGGATARVDVNIPHARRRSDRYPVPPARPRRGSAGRGRHRHLDVDARMG